VSSRISARAQARAFLFGWRAFGNSFYWPQINADEIDLLNKNPKFAYQQTGFIKIKVYLHLSVAEVLYHSFRKFAASRPKAMKKPLSPVIASVAKQSPGRYGDCFAACGGSQ
jgi:hypothetical protein